MITIFSVRSDELVMYRGIDGAYKTNIQVDLNVSTSQGIPIYIESQFKETEGDLWRSNVLYPPSAQSIRIKDVEVGVAYNIRVRTVYADGSSDEWSESWDDAVAQGASAQPQAIVTSHTVQGNTLLPPDLDDLVVSQDSSGDNVNFSWTYTNRPVGLLGVEIRYGSTQDWATMTPLATVHQGTNFSTTQVPAGDWEFAARPLANAANPATQQEGIYSAVPLYRSFTVRARTMDITLQFMSFAAYSGLRVDTPVTFPDLGAAWQPINIFNEITPTTPRFITANLTNHSFSVDNEGVYVLTITGTFEHNSLNQGRVTYLRSWDLTSGVQVGNDLPLPTGRNAEATPIAVSTFFEVTAAVEDHEIRLEIGAGDTYTSVIFNVLNYQIHSIGEWREAIA